MQVDATHKISNPFERSQYSPLICILLLLASIRGVIVVNFDVSANTVYVITSLLLTLVSIVGIIQSSSYKEGVYKNLIKILNINVFLFILNILIELLITHTVDFAVIYYCLAPFSIFVFTRIKNNHLYISISIISLLLGYSVLQNFIESLSGEAGIENVVQYHLKLRPEIFESLSKTGDFFRVGGYTGSYHDSANILGMTSSFFFIKFIIDGKIIDLVISIFTILCLTITQSAANIVVAVITLFIFSIISIRISKRTSSYFYFIFLIASFIALFYCYGDAMTIFTDRLNKDGDWEGMSSALNFNTISQSFLFIILGHAGAFSADIIKTEVSFLKQIVQLGIFHAFINFWILLYPFYRLRKKRIKNLDPNYLPYLAAIFFGVLSLIHYGSLLRITSIFLFYSFVSRVLLLISDEVRLQKQIESIN